MSYIFKRKYVFTRYFEVYHEYKVKMLDVSSNLYVFDCLVKILTP